LPKESKTELSTSEQPKPLVVPEKIPNVLDEPDKFTRKDPSFIEGGAPNQVFSFEKFGIRYGTDDKKHAAALLLSLLLLVLLLVLIIGGFFSQGAWVSDALTILGTAFTFTAGVAIGQGASKD